MPTKQSSCLYSLTHNKETNNQCWAIGREFLSMLVLRTLLKNPLGVGWGLLPILLWVGSWLPTYLTSLFRQVEIRFHSGNQTANHFTQKWVPLHYHLIVKGILDFH